MRSVSRAARTKETGCHRAHTTVAPINRATPASRMKCVRSRSRRSSASVSSSGPRRMENRSTGTPSRSSASISRRMNVWLTFGYWFTRYATPPFAPGLGASPPCRVEAPGSGSRASSGAVASLPIDSRRCKTRALDSGLSRRAVRRTTLGGLLNERVPYLVRDRLLSRCRESAAIELGELELVPRGGGKRGHVESHDGQPFAEDRERDGEQQPRTIARLYDDHVRIASVVEVDGDRWWSRRPRRLGRALLERADIDFAPQERGDGPADRVGNRPGRSGCAAGARRTDRSPRRYGAAGCGNTPGRSGYPASARRWPLSGAKGALRGHR